MDIILVIIGGILMVLGIIGSFLPVLPGPLTSWIGLLVLHFTEAIPTNWTFLIITLIIAIAILVLDYIIPAIGTKKFGGSKAGAWGTIIGLIIGLLAPIPFGFLIGPFVGALVGEMVFNQTEGGQAVKAAFGSFIGFLASTFMKLVATFLYLGLFIWKVWEYKDLIF